MTTQLRVTSKSFRSAKAWEEWLAKHHGESPGIWLRIYRKGTNVESVTFAEALDVALCYGWIDSQMRGLDEHSYLQKFSPRRTKSSWSALNKSHVARLIKASRMQPAGLAEIRRAKANGRWGAE